MLCVLIIRNGCLYSLHGNFHYAILQRAKFQMIVLRTKRQLSLYPHKKNAIGRIWLINDITYYEVFFPWGLLRNEKFPTCSYG